MRNTAAISKYSITEVGLLPRPASTRSSDEGRGSGARGSVGTWGGGMPTVDSLRDVTSILEEAAVELPARVVRL
jgi:hypothetical protein